MFDIGFSELMVIAVVALIVIGPERLPRVARTAGVLLGRVRRYAADVKADISRETQLDELRKMQQEVTERIASVESSVRQEMHEVETSVGTVIAPPEVKDAVPPAPIFSDAPTLPETVVPAVPTGSPPIADTGVRRP
jgi:sec-independent protein translocase protein TatB